MKKDILSEVFKNQRIVSIYTNEHDTETFAAGFILKMDEHTIIIAHISPSGKYDGYIAKKLDDVYLATADGKYEHKLQKLYYLQNQNHERNGGYHRQREEKRFRQLFGCQRDPATDAQL